MKKNKKIITLFAAALLCVLPILSTPITAKAVEPTTYSVKYDSESGDWRYMAGQWNDESTSRELYYLEQEIVDGDYLVVAGTNGDTLELDVRLGNLTIVNTGSPTVFTVKGIDNLYVLNNSQCAINGNVTNAYIYDSGLCNLNNNVSNLEIIGTSSGLSATVAAVGTVGHVKGYDNYNVHFELYSFKQGTLYIEKGTLKTEETEYSEAPVADTATAPATSPTTPSGAAASTGSSEYDDVPKTGETNTVVWLMAIALFCMVGYYQLKKSK
ncbi:MAG: hypothetical protein IJ029_09990 [Lachnospiraceae bacterium]|nr:hypothetical protein [Lachnospiraceae bacterium]